MEVIGHDERFREEHCLSIYILWFSLSFACLNSCFFSIDWFVFLLGCFFSSAFLLLSSFVKRSQCQSKHPYNFRKLSLPREEHWGAAPLLAHVPAVAGLLFSIVLYYTILYYTTLHYTILYYTIL